MKKGSAAPVLGWKRMILGMASGLLTTLVLTGALAALLERELLAVEWSRGLAVVVLLVSGFACGIWGGSGATGLETGLGAFGYWLILLGINTGLYGGNRSGMAVTLLAIAGGWGSSLLLRLGSSRRSSRSYRRKKRNVR